MPFRINRADVHIYSSQYRNTDRQIAPLVASGALSMPVAGEFGLEDYTEAFALAAKLRGKAIFHPNRRQ